MASNPPDTGGNAMKTLLAVLVAAALAAGCASQGGLEKSKGERVLSKYEPYVGEPVKSFTAFRQHSWQPVSRTQLILWTTINDAYLLTVANSCPDMMFANAVSVSSSGSAISTFDFVTVRGNRCPIQQIEPIDVRAWRRDRDANQAAS
jgi:Family of unknown function (DUF6491)